MTPRPSSPAEARAQARRLRLGLAARGNLISYAEALEQVAHRNGFRDWNTCIAALARLEQGRWRAGARVSGHYLSQPFEATVKAAEQMEAGRIRLHLDFDRAVDVVTFASFSNLRKRVTCVVGADGCTRERTSDGVPHLRLDPGAGAGSRAARSL